MFLGTLFVSITGAVPDSMLIFQSHACCLLVASVLGRSNLRVHEIDPKHATYSHVMIPTAIFRLCVRGAEFSDKAGPFGTRE